VAAAPAEDGKNRYIKMKWLIFAIFLACMLLSCSTSSSTIKDAPNKAPSVFIDSISPSEIISGESVSFAGHGSDIDGTVITYKWRSSIDGDLSTKPSFSTYFLSEGKHTILFKVQDNTGNWSDEISRTLTVISGKSVPSPVIDFFQVTPGRISLGSSATISWHITNATTAFIDQEIGNVALDGNLKVNPILSTEYTLTATNEGSNTSSRQVTILVVPARTGLPVINSFAADPGNIMIGNSATLRWNISNADFVKVDPDLGTVEPIGSAPVKPSKTTSYTIVAYNSVGIVLSTTQIMVTTAQVSGIPDLVITGMGKVDTATGTIIGYTVKNQGTNDAPPSTTRLYANGIFRASDALGVVPAGDSVSRQISSWLYNPSTSVIKVILDADNNLVESDKNNNSKQIALPVRTVFDFIENARSAAWGVEYPYKSLVFGDTTVEKNGFVTYLSNARMEDASTPTRVLETRPYSIFNGRIIGEYNINLPVKSGDAFYGLAGLLEGGQMGGVELWGYIRQHGQADWEVLVPGVADTYDYRIKAIGELVPPYYFGKNVDIKLEVHADGEPLQDWAAWIEAKIIR
jgi:hypothetical protein